MDIILTGEVGIGKTTVCQKVVGIVQDKGYTCGGILTYKAADKSLVVADLQSGDQETLAAITNIYHGPKIGQYFFNPAGIEFGIGAIETGISCDFLFIDEIGHLELNGGGFSRALQLFGTNRVKSSVVVIRKELLEAFSSGLGVEPSSAMVIGKELLDAFPSGFILEPSILEITRDNRDELPQTICTYLFHNFLQLIEGG